MHTIVMNMLNEDGVSMRSEIRRIRRPLTDEELESVGPKESRGGSLDDMLENISLRDVPLEERRKEAKKPLYLIRYE
jgi:hypothetical protein